MYNLIPSATAEGAEWHENLRGTPPQMLINTYTFRHTKEMSYSRSYPGEYVDLSKIPSWRVPVGQFIMEGARHSDLLPRQSVVSNQLYCLICADDKLQCSWATQEINDFKCTGCPERHSPDTQLCHSYNYGTDLSFNLSFSLS